jgi:hypothetical protein
MPIIVGRTRYDLATNITLPPITRIDVVDVMDRENFNPATGTSTPQFHITVAINSSAANGRTNTKVFKVGNGGCRGLKLNATPAGWEDIFLPNDLVKPTGYTDLEAAIQAVGATKKARFDAALDWCIANGFFVNASDVTIAGTRV